MTAAPTVSVWRQPMRVWAVAFACVVAFMGIGLVDPILPAIAEQLQASPVETELLFTSYLVVTGLAMLVTSLVSSRIGAKATLLIGLALIVVFALLCALSGSVDAIIGFRAGWGLGNALFISTALATIVGAASGGSGAAIVLYEAALGLGIAIGPLLGGLLGSISWRGPFFGVAVLMAIAFIGVSVLLRGGEDGERRPTSLSATRSGRSATPRSRCWPWPPCSTTSASSCCWPSRRSRSDSRRSASASRSSAGASRSRSRASGSLPCSPAGCRARASCC